MSADWRVDQDLDVGLLPVEAGLLVADILDRVAGGGFDQLMGDRLGSADFAGEHELVGRGQGFDRYAGVRVMTEIQIHDGVGNAVADLVWMALGN